MNIWCLMGSQTPAKSEVFLFTGTVSIQSTKLSLRSESKAMNRFPWPLQQQKNLFIITSVSSMINPNENQKLNDSLICHSDFLEF